MARAPRTDSRNPRRLWTINRTWLQVTTLEDRITPDWGVDSELLQDGRKADGGRIRGWYDAVYYATHYDEITALQANNNPDRAGGDVNQPPPTNPEVEPSNILLNNNSGSTGTQWFTQSETTLLAFGNTVIAGYNDSGSNGFGNRFTGYSRSTDGGATWTDGGVLPGNNDAGDPVLARHDASGVIYYSTLMFTGNGIQMFRSFDNGATFTSPVNAAPGSTGFADKQWHAVDNFPGAGNGNVYMIYRDFGAANGIFLTRSTDGGNTFTGNVSIVSGNQGAWVTVGPDHSVYAFWFQSTGIFMRKSTDFGLTFGASSQIMAFSSVGGTNGDLGLTGIRQGTGTPASFRSNMFGQVVVNPVNGHLYAIAPDNPVGTDKGDIAFVMSTNGGATWSPKTRINTDAGLNDQFQPTIAVTPDGTRLGVFWYDRREDAANNLIKYYGRLGNISGATVTWGTDFAVSDVAFLPEFGRDSVVNSTYMGDYDQATATNDAFHVIWADNRADLPGGAGRKDPNVFYKRIELGLSVIATTPAVGSIVNAPPTSFTVQFSEAIAPASLAASDFTVNGIPATGVSLNGTNTIATFTYGVSPVSTEGLQTMAMASGAVNAADDNAPINAFSGTFRYDLVTLAVTGTNPVTPNGVLLLPSPNTIRVFFNEAILPGSVSTADFTTSVGTITSVTPVLGNTAVDVVISGLTVEGSLTLGLPANTVTDGAGNPNPAPFTGTYQIDIGTVPYPVPLVSKAPLGSLVYDPLANGIINFAGDIDSFTIHLDPGQTLTIIIRPTAPLTLQPTIQLFDPSNASMGFAAAPGVGQVTGAQTAPVAVGGIYRIAVGSVGGTLGSYSVQVILNAAIEFEGLVVGATNNTSATAQNIDGSFINLTTDLVQASRGAVLGTTDSATPYSASGVPFTFSDITATGTVRHGTGVDDSTTNVPIPFTFSFYGVGYTSVFVSSNGHMTFGTGDSSFSNSDLTTTPTQAAIAVLWDDLHTGTIGNVKSQVIGAVGSRQLIVQWDNIRYFSGSIQTLKFQAILFETSNQILLNYQNINTSTGEFQTGGASATVGIKNSNTLGANPLLISLNGSNPTLVGSGKSILIAPTALPADYYVFSGTGGQPVSVGIQNLTAGNVDVQLLAPNGVTVLASGISGASNLNEIISNFVLPATGNYFVRVIGSSNGTQYNLFVTRNAAFDTEANNTQGTAQNLGTSQGALGYARSGAGSTADFETGQQGWTINNNLPGIGTGLWHLSTRRGTNPGHSPVTSFYYGREDTGTFDTGVRNAGAIDSPVQVIPAGANLSFNYFLQTEGGTTFDRATVEISTNGGATWTVLAVMNQAAAFTTFSTSLAAFGGLSAQIRFRFDTVDSIANSFEGWYVDDITIGSPSDTDWYRTTLAADQTVLEVETRTPGDGPGEFVNTFNPKIEVFDAGGTLVGTGVVLGDGRNEKIRITGLIPGATYFIRVTGEGNSAGEYFVGAKALRTPTITTKVDDGLPNTWGPDGSFAVPNPAANGWVSVSGAGYLGDHLVHTDNVNEMATNFAVWNIKITSLNPELFASWVPRPTNATNATYQVYRGATLLATIVVNQKVSPNDALYGTTLLESLGSYVVPTGTTMLTVRLLTVGANGDLVADGVFDPPAGDIVDLRPMVPPTSIAGRDLVGGETGPRSAMTMAKPSTPAVSRSVKIDGISIAAGTIRTENPDRPIDWTPSVVLTDTADFQDWTIRLDA